MERHPNIASDGLPCPPRHIHLTLTEAEAAALAALLARAVRDADVDEDAGVVDALEGAGRLLDARDARAQAPVRFGLPEEDVLRLPRTGVVLCGPGVGTAVAIHGAVVADGRGVRAAWEMAAREVGAELAAAVLAGGARGDLPTPRAGVPGGLQGGGCAPRLTARAPKRGPRVIGAQGALWHPEDVRRPDPELGTVPSSGVYLIKPAW